MSWSKLRFMLFALLLGVTACTSDSCSSGCGGITPLQGGFNKDLRIENGAAVRITQKGFDFLEQNLGAIASKLIGGGAGVIEFPINESSGSSCLLDLPIVGCTLELNYTICPGGPDSATKKCVAEIDLANADLAISAQQPHNILITGDIPLRLQNLPIDSNLADFTVTMSNNGSCPGENSVFAPVNATVNISIEADTDMAHARFGYSKVKIQQLTISKNDIEDALKLNCDGGLVDELLEFAKGLVVDQLFDGLTDTLAGTVEQQLCQKGPNCPTGSNDVGGTCRYGTAADSECVSMALGLDGNANLSGLLSSLSPGTKGGMDFLLAAGGHNNSPLNKPWGDLQVIGNGGTLGMYGGVEPKPISNCVPMSDLPRPANIPIPDELLDDALITNWPADLDGPHIGIGLSQSFLNYAFSGLYNSGLFCIGISTETADLLNSGTFGLLVGSLADLTLQQQPAPVAIMIRPSTPPNVTFGGGTNIETDPLLMLELKKASFDFYVFSSDRFVRFMTATFDITAPINLEVTPEGLTPVLKTVKVENGVVTNSEMLVKEDPAVLAKTLQTLLAGQVGALLGGGFSPIDINGPLADLGLKLVIPPSVEGQGSPGLRKVVKNNEPFLGIFASFDTAMMATAYSAETTAELVRKEVDRDGLRGKTLTDDNAPQIEIAAGSPDDDGVLAVEYQARVDGGAWKPFESSRTLRIEDPMLRLEGKHVVEVRSRIRGDAYSLDMTPARVEVIVDTLPPQPSVTAVDDGGNVGVNVFDLVSRDATMVRYRIDGDAFTDWMPVGEVGEIRVGDDAEEIEVEARDEEGNVGTAQQALIRGLPRGSSDGCGCSLPGSDTSGHWKLALLVGGVMTAFARLARRRAPVRAVKATRSVRRARVSPLTGVTLTVVSGWMMGNVAGCSCGDETIEDGNYACVAPDCVDLDPGLVGSYTSTTVADGKLWVAGYLEGDYTNARPFGDLVVGQYDDAAQKVVWEVVDGVPNEEVDGTKYNKNGFRGGVTGFGDDVGLWTSIAVDSKGNPAVAYYDRTNKGLKFARDNGVIWEIAKVDDGMTSDTGRYAKLHFDGDKAVIAYLSIEPAATGFITSKVRVARDGGGANFTSEDVVVNKETPCRAEFCTGGSSCVEDSGRCAKTASGCANCADGESCVDDGAGAECKTVLKPGKLDAYPLTTGLYIATAPVPGGGFAIAYYDRVAGTVNLATQKSGKWGSIVVDGGGDPPTNDPGIGTSLFVDSAGTFHLTYVDGYDEVLKYAQVTKDGMVKPTEVVDDGLSVGGVPFPDGKHIVGDDSFVTVSGSGEVRVTYQDATTGKLRYAVGAPKTGAHDWKVKVVDADHFGGFFSNQVELGGSLKFVYWWRVAKETTKGDVAVVSPP